MALLDFLKNKKKEGKINKPKEKKREKPEKKEVVVKKEEKEKPAVAKSTQPKRQRKITGDSVKVLKSPHIAEKSTDLLGNNQYVFKVWPRVNKVETKKAIESIFKVDVVGVRIVNLPKKKRRLGKTQGFTKGYKKAIVRIKEGQKIEILSR
ncbi:MAG: 50S ribosomal protein L23 [Candidatus Nealsonbacteria bacterium]|nr:50S ribosomal protein L23 [Candidatus Nealsonbacteria bacterium]